MIIPIWLKLAIILLAPFAYASIIVHAMPRRLALVLCTLVCLMAVVLTLACGNSPRKADSAGFRETSPRHCFEVKYASGETLEVARMCFRYSTHCDVGRSGALKHGHWAGAVAVSQCWRTE